MLYYLVCTSVVLSFSAIPCGWAETAQTAESLIAVKLDKERYNRGDLMIVSGAVKNLVNQIPLTVQVFDPVRNLVHVEQTTVAADGRFSLPVKTEGPLWNVPGTYSLVVQYGFKHVSATVQFKFEQEDIPTEGVFNVKDLSSGQNFDLNYTVTGGQVNSMVIEPQDLALVIQVDAQNAGMVHLQIPRLLLDAKTPGNSDESFLVFVNDDEVTSFHEGSPDAKYRALDIPIVSGDYKIEIIGTTIVPEFEGMSGLILVASVGVSVFVIATMRTGCQGLCI